MSTPLSPEALDTLFREARTHRAWLNRPVADDLLRQLYDLMKFGPTSANCCPARILFIRTQEAKQRLKPALAAGNVDRTMAAPVVAVVGYDLAFYESLPRLAPSMANLRDKFAKDAELRETTAKRNGTLQGGYFILAARSLGLDCGPMSGFDNSKVDAEFFAATQVKSNFLCNLGYGDASKLTPRQPRLAFDEGCKLI